MTLDLTEQVETLETELLGSDKDIVTETVEKVPRKPFVLKYIYIAAVLVPVLVILATFFTIPKKAKRQAKQKYYMFAAGIIIVYWVLLGVAAYFKRELLDYSFKI